MRKVCYLGGTIANLSYKDATEHRNKIKAYLAERGWDSLDPMRGKEILSSVSIIEERDAVRLLGVTDAAIIERDYDDLRRADVLIVLSGDKASWGTAFEWSIAHFQMHKPVVVVCAEDAPIRDHPWCKLMCSGFFSTMEAAVDFIDTWLDRGYTLPDELVPPHENATVDDQGFLVRLPRGPDSVTRPRWESYVDMGQGC